MATTKDLKKVLRDYQQNHPESRGIYLRLDLAQIMVRRLNANGWTLDKLAMRAEITVEELDSIMHGVAVVTFETAGRILFALGVTAKLVEVEP